MDSRSTQEDLLRPALGASAARNRSLPRLLRTGLAGCLALSLVGALTSVAWSAKKPFKPKTGVYLGPLSHNVTGSIKIKLRAGLNNNGDDVVRLENFLATAKCGGGINRGFSGPIEAKRQGRNFSV